MDRAIEWLENNNQHGSQSNELEHASQEILEQCERLARFELQKHELDLLKTAKEQIDAFKEEVQKAIYVVQTVIFTDAASRAPTSKQIDVIEQDIEKLEQMIAEEKKKQDEKKRAQDAAMLNKGMLKTSFSSLMFFTMDLVCPFALEMDKPVYRVVFGHIVQGLRTTFELGDFGSNCVEQNALQPYNTKPIPKEHLAANFYDALLCSTEGSGVQEPILTPWTDPEDISCNLLDLSVVLGRMDMVALCLQDLMEAYDVSLHQLTENGCPVVVVRVHLPRKTTLDAHYVRTNHRSVFWSLPAIVRVKQDGKICDALTPNFLKIEKCRSLSATVGYLRAACEIVLETVSRQVSVSTG